MRLIALSFALTLAITSFAACGDDGGTTTTDTNVADTTVADTTVTDTTVTDTTVADTAVTDTAVADTAVPDSSPGCLERASTLTGATDQRLVIEAVRFGASTDEAVVRNVSNTAVTITSSWRFCSIPDYGAPVAADTVIEPNTSMTFTLPISVDATDELALYNSTTYTSSTAIEAFVAWGAAPGGSSRVGVAVSAGFWQSATAFIAVASGHDGFLANGAQPAQDPALYKSVAPSCPLQ